MNAQPIIPAEKLRTLNEVTERLRYVPNVAAVVLGGSYAQGLARPESDIDIGL
jgi:predicted nucleotidyltransferase